MYYRAIFYIVPFTSFLFSTIVYLPSPLLCLLSYICVLLIPGLVLCRYISPNIRYGVYKFGMRSAGTDVIWEETWNRYQAAVGQERTNLAYCLAQTTRTWLIQR